jgi:diaminohydroxyphosphoribosylaminopyrimidine deaminase/5-amino-6-(5-phosphoribosylamino)uracil reductase
LSVACRPTADTHDQRFKDVALTLGRRGLGNTWANPAVGAAVVRDDGSGPVN